MICIQIRSILRLTHSGKDLAVWLSKSRISFDPKRLQSFQNLFLRFHNSDIVQGLDLFHNTGKLFILAIIASRRRSSLRIHFLHYRRICVITVDILYNIIDKQYGKAFLRRLEQGLCRVKRKLILHHHHGLITNAIRRQLSVRHFRTAVIQYERRNILISITCILQIHILPVITLVIVRPVSAHLTDEQPIVDQIVIAKHQKIDLGTSLLEHFLHSGQVRIHLGIIRKARLSLIKTIGEQRLHSLITRPCHILCRTISAGITMHDRLLDTACKLQIIQLAIVSVIIAVISKKIRSCLRREPFIVQMRSSREHTISIQLVSEFKRFCLQIIDGIDRLRHLHRLSVSRLCTQLHISCMKPVRNDLQTILLIKLGRCLIKIPAKVIKLNLRRFFPIKDIIELNTQRINVVRCIRNQKRQIFFHTVASAGFKLLEHIRAPEVACGILTLYTKLQRIHVQSAFVDLIDHFLKILSKHGAVPIIDKGVSPGFVKVVDRIILSGDRSGVAFTGTILIESKQQIISIAFRCKVDGICSVTFLHKFCHRLHIICVKHGLCPCCFVSPTDDRSSYHTDESLHCDIFGQHADRKLSAV